MLSDSDLAVIREMVREESEEQKTGFVLSNVSVESYVPPRLLEKERKSCRSSGRIDRRSLIAYSTDDGRATYAVRGSKGGLRFEFRYSLDDMPTRKADDHSSGCRGSSNWQGWAPLLLREFIGGNKTTMQELSDGIAAERLRKNDDLLKTFP